MKDIESKIYLPGEIIKLGNDELHGHGIVKREDNNVEEHVITCFGRVSKINKLVYIKPIFRLKYKPSIGDMIIGVIEKIGNKRWFLNINSMKCILNTSAIIQPSADIKTEIIMRDHLNIGDIIICEVQKVGNYISVHTHQQNYGKRNGVLVKVPQFLINNSFIFETLRKDLKVVVGLNGFILTSGQNTIKMNTIIKYLKDCRNELKIITEEEIKALSEE